MSEVTPVVVDIQRVDKFYGAVQILKDVTMQVRRGEVVSVIGASGSGKSTLLRCVNALTPIQGGDIKVGDIRICDPSLDKGALRKRVGMIFQQYNLFPHWTVLQNITKAPIHVLGQRRKDAELRALALLEKVGLVAKQHSYPGELSGGQQQRVAIARALAMRPDVMMFDEVTAALDPKTSSDVLAAIEELAEEGMTCIIVTHEMSFARKISDTVYFLEHGSIVESGPPEQIFGAPSEPRTPAFIRHAD